LADPRTLLIDADILLHRAASAVENEVEFEEDIWVLWTDENEAIEAFNTQVAALLEQANTYSYLLCFSDSRNFRKDLFPDYKGNRKQRKPMGFKAIRERIISEAPPRSVAMWPTLEADDLLGIYATRNPEQYIIWSEDKDLMQIPGKHLVDGWVVEVSKENANLMFYTQTLTGDVTDNYKGCPGVGPVKAAAILKGKEGDGLAEWERIVNAYTKAGLTEQDALLNARLARILRAEDWNYRTNEVKLWTPSTPSK
jgi:DNA polymerase-1